MTPMTVKAKGQVTIPEPIRTRYGFHPDARVVWIDRDGEPRPVVRGLGALRGRLRSGTAGRSLRAALAEERAAERVREDG